MKKLLLSMLILLSSSAFAWKVTPLTTERASTIKMEVDVAQESTPLDILFVVDNSGSMGGYQKTLADNVDALIGRLVKYDVHAAVVTTDMQAPTQAGKFVNGFLQSADTDFLKKLRNNILVGTAGSGTEELFSPVIAALTPPLSLNENKGFLRADADLVVVFVTDAEDQSLTLTPAGFVSSLEALKVNTAGKIRTVSIYAESNGNCEKNEDPAHKLEEALVALKATTVSICDLNMSKKLTDIGELLTTGLTYFDRKIKLPVAPVLSTVKVTYGPTALEMGDFYQGWTYDSKNMMLWIGEDFNFATQPVGTKLLIEYTIK